MCTILCSNTFGDNAQRFGYLQLETAIKKFMIMSFVYSVQSGEYSAADLFLAARLWTLAEADRLCANEGGGAASLPCVMWANILKRGLLRIPSGCAEKPVATNLTSARAVEIDWTARDCLSRFLHDFADATIFP